jgi:prephenate dehydrogenase
MKLKVQVVNKSGFEFWNLEAETIKDVIDFMKANNKKIIRITKQEHENKMNDIKHVT